ncbi:LemA family protein [Thiopseudomonas acetoxidans]|uniref:LemA family protein n=1 Tax=Thiopseudomonas acetoxidans TaxID=3041622 RepID=A0ABT7SP88_9GAMM|nr:LemA family protein [Thiopseudomonas sp. CY1220]MDM7857372.1 LemA family protein [Thiopseudomonas sp. CY1220]
MTGWIILGVIVLIVLWGFVTYNALVALRNSVKNGFAQIDVQLQRRYDLIPNLVETAKTYLKHERETLEAVINARNQAQSASKKASSDPTDGSAIRSLSGAEGMLGAAMGRFFALAEAYPDLKANQTMQQLTEQLSSTENRVAFARQAYNDAVMSYNIKRESAPNNIIANNFGFKAAQMLEIESPEARQAVKVKFD